MPNRTLSFVLGFSFGAVTMLLANLMPYWQSDRAYDGDGYEVIGFPYTFRKLGGYARICRFSSHLLLADIAISAAVAVCFGVIAIWLMDRSRPRGRGFDPIL